MMTYQPADLVRAESFDIASPHVVVDSVSNEVHVEESLDGRSYVDFYTSSEKGKRRVEEARVTVNGNTLSVELDAKSRGFRGVVVGRSVDVVTVLRVPGTATFRVRVVSADVRVNASFQDLEISTVSGNVKVLRNPRRECSIKTVSGDMEAHTFSACNYRFKSVSGDIEVHVAPDLVVDVDGSSLSGELTSEISLTEDDAGSNSTAEIVTINSSTISGNFSLSRN